MPSALMLNLENHCVPKNSCPTRGHDVVRSVFTSLVGTLIVADDFSACFDRSPLRFCRFCRWFLFHRPVINTAAAVRLCPTCSQRHNRRLVCRHGIYLYHVPYGHGKPLDLFVIQGRDSCQLACVTYPTETLRAVPNGAFFFSRFSDIEKSKSRL